MKQNKGSSMPESEAERETNLLNTIAGNREGEYFVLANWGDDPNNIHGCIVEVHSIAGRMNWRTIYKLDMWIHVLRKLTSDALLIGNIDGDLIRIEQGRVETIKIGLEGGIADIWVINEVSCWLAYDGGLAHWDGRRISRHGPNAIVNAIHALSSDFAVAVGRDGLVLFFDGKNWKEIESSPTNKNLVGVFCVDRNKVFVSGWRGALYKWDGQDKWEKIKFIGGINADEISAYKLVAYRGVIYVCAGGRGLFKIQGNKAEQVQTFNAGRAVTIDDKLIVTGRNLFHEFDGVNWSEIEITLPE